METIKKYWGLFLVFFAASFFCFAVFSYGEPLRNYGEGYSDTQFIGDTVVISSGMNSWVWNRRVSKVDVVVKTSHTLHIDWWNKRFSSVTAYGASDEAYAIDRAVGLSTPTYVLDYATVTTHTIYSFPVDSREFSVWVSTDENLNLPDIEIRGWGW